MNIREKTTEVVAQDLLGNEEAYRGNTVIYKVDLEKVRAHSPEAITNALNEMFGVIAVDIDDDGIAEKMFLDGPLGPFLSRDDKKVDLYEEAMEDL